VVITKNFQILLISILEEMGSSIERNKKQIFVAFPFIHKFNFETFNTFFSLFRKAEAKNRGCCTLTVCGEEAQH
jgi:hypothetical protein